MKQIFYIFFIVFINLIYAQSSGAKYLVITHDNFYNAIQPLAQWKHKKGLVTKVATLSEIGATPESLARIKNYIVNAYNTWNPRPEYILLVGSPHFIRTDNNMYDDFYANMSGNFLMELPIGRLPCSTATQCSVMVTKTLGYERTPHILDTLWFKKGNGMVREDVSAVDSLYWANMRYIYNLWQLAGYVLIDSFSRLRGDSVNDVIQAINDGRSFVVYRGQCVANWWPPFNIDPTLTNNGFKLPIVVSATCATINLYPSYGPYQGDRFLKAGSVITPKGAVAFFGTTNTATGTGIAQLRGIVSTNFFKAVFNENIYKIGDAAKRAKFVLDSIRPPAYNSTFYREWNLLGDPELNIWTQVPKQFTVVYDTVIPTGQQTYSVTVRQGTNPVPNALVCIIKDTSIYQSNWTNSAGNVSFSINPQTIGTMSLTITAQNFKPFEGTVSIRSAGIEDVSKFQILTLNQVQGKFQIIPNPCQDFVEIHFNQKPIDNCDILIYDIQGRCVGNWKLEIGNWKLNLREIPTGVYMIVYKGSDRKFIGKVVKQ